MLSGYVRFVMLHRLKAYAPRKGRTAKVLCVSRSALETLEFGGPAESTPYFLATELPYKYPGSEAPKTRPDHGVFIDPSMVYSQLGGLSSRTYERRLPCRCHALNHVSVEGPLASDGTGCATGGWASSSCNLFWSICVENLDAIA